MSKLFNYAIPKINLPNLIDYIKINGKLSSSYKYIDDINKINEILDCDIKQFCKNAINFGTIIYDIKEVSESNKVLDNELIGLIQLVDYDAENVFMSNGDDYFFILYTDGNGNLICNIKKDFSKIRIIYEEMAG